jgi:phospholipase C
VGGLLLNNPNVLNASVNGTGAINPFRLGRTQAWTASQGHGYTAEQLAYDKGLMDQFPKQVGKKNSAAMTPSQSGPLATPWINLGYFDGNTVTAMWNYAQRFALNDNSYNTVFGPSTPGALNLISGQTNGVALFSNGTGAETDDGNGGLSVIGDPDPMFDVCSGPTTNQVQMNGRNVGDMMNDAGISWGWFQGGFALDVKNPNNSTGCTRSTVSQVIAAVSPSSATITDYSPHHQPFQYYPSTLNATHVRTSGPSMVGKAGDAANHQYDLEDFYAAVKAGNFPTVSFLKAAAYQDAHPGNSDPIDEQAFVVKVINFLQEQPDWCDTVVIIAYDDSDGWYDHQMGPIVNQSTSPADGLSGSTACGTAGMASALAGPGGVLHAQGRCGYGPRTPLLVISPWAKANYVDHTVTDQTSILRFIEDTFLDGERIGDGSFDAIANPLDNMFDFEQGPRCKVPDKLFLDEDTGLIDRHHQQQQHQQ